METTIVRKTLRGSANFILIFMLTLAPSGCGSSVELKGGVFEMTGLNTIGTRIPEQKLSKRNILVIPPTTPSLPIPGYGFSDQRNSENLVRHQSWPIDPDQIKVVKDVELELQHEKFCEDARIRHRLKLDVVLAHGPLGSCDKSIIKNIMGKSLTDRSYDRNDIR
ncbi:MAG: hypothetical protein HRT83_06400 [Hyphomicrobiaceae bacterium]|nr:hypothetical protein [Hyphomicrobiaceae bacterium]